MDGHKCRRRLTAMAVKREVELLIRSRSSGSGKVEQKVRGQLYERDGRWMYHYREPDSEMGKVMATLKVQPGIIRLLRQGDIRSEQQFSAGRKLPGYYDTAHGRFELDAETHKLQTELTDEGLGRLAWVYDLYVSGERTGRYELTIEVKAVAP
jgi:uncharacterized beta-barrel protein YwiB (DUF1934 family)